MNFPVEEELFEFSLTEKSQLNDLKDFQNEVFEEDVGDASFDRDKSDDEDVN